MNRADQPAKLYFGNDELNAFESVFGAGAIVKQQQDSRDDLDREEKQRHPAEVVPDRMAMNWDFLLLRDSGERTDGQTLVKPVFYGFDSHDKLTTEDTEESKTNEPRKCTKGTERI